MQKFQQILQEAAQLKETQLKNQRKNYESLPQYLKFGLNYSKKYQIVRKQHYMIQMHLSEKVKKEGNMFFKSQRYAEALVRYEEALSVFRYINTQSYDNMKDEHLSYEKYELSQENAQFKQEYDTHMVALYLNICSCLTKLNKKEDALHSADQALKVKETAKGYYKKARAYLQYINRETDDIKLGFYYLNKCYEMSKDQAVVQEMHKIKKEIDEQRSKEKNWFKFMFDKNSKSKEESQSVKEVKQIKQEGEKVVCKKENERNSQLQELQKNQRFEPEDEKLEKTKQKLFKFANLDLSQDQWLLSYQGQFIAKHGSKIYSILQIFGKRQYLGEYKAMLAQCLQFKKENDNPEKRKQAYGKYIQWLRLHPIDKIAKYIERYDLQTKWVREQRQILNNKQKEKEINTVEDKQKKDPQESVLFEKIQTKPTQTAQHKQGGGNAIDLIEQVTKIIEKNPEQLKTQHSSESKPQYTENPQEQESNSTPESQVQVDEPASSKATQIKIWSFGLAFALLIVLKFLI